MAVVLTKEVLFIDEFFLLLEKPLKGAVKNRDEFLEELRRGSPKQQEIARRWNKEVRPVRSKKVGSDAAIQTVEEQRRKVATTQK